MQIEGVSKRFGVFFLECFWDSGIKMLLKSAFGGRSVKRGIKKREALSIKCEALSVKH